MAAVQLEHPYVRIVKGDTISYGGCQLWSGSQALRRCGCGPVAALDAAIYGSRAHGGGDRLLDCLPREGPIPLELYERLLEKLVRRYVPVVPPFGTNPTALTLGLNRLFRAEDIPLRAHVLPATKAAWPRVWNSLQQDSPALLAIGQNFPKLWQKNHLRFYVRRPDGSYAPASGAKAHFVAVTDMEDEWLRISSWGRMYYIRLPEFDRYVEEHSASLICGVITIEKSSGQ